MTTKERLRRYVDGLSDSEAEAALAVLERTLPRDDQSEDLPSFVGMLHSGKGDLAARSSEILRAEFGRD